MAKTIQEILGGKNLTGVIQGVQAGVPQDLLPPALLATTRTVEGDYGTYTKVDGTRKTARLAQYGSPSQQRQLPGVSEVSVKLIHTVESVFHKPAVLMNLTSFDSDDKQRLGEQEIARRTAEFKRLFVNLRASAVYSMLAQGAIYFDADGNLLPDSTGSAVTVDFGISAGNKDQLDVFGDGDIIAADWSIASTEIHKHVAAIKRAARKLTGYPIRHAFYGSNLLDYFLDNTALSSLISDNTGFQESAAGGEIPDGLLGLSWHPVEEAFYVDNDGSYQEFFDGDTVVFTPEPMPEWYELLEGTYPVPTDVGAVASDAAETLGGVAIDSGMFSYATVTTDPVAIKHVAGDTFLPVLKVPKAVFIAKVANYS